MKDDGGRKGGMEGGNVGKNVCSLSLLKANPSTKP